jgi:hypothetical protein
MFLNAAGMFDLAKFKEYLRLTLRKHNTWKIEK